MPYDQFIYMGECYMQFFIVLTTKVYITVIEECVLQLSFPLDQAFYLTGDLIFRFPSLIWPQRSCNNQFFRASAAVIYKII